VPTVASLLVTGLADHGVSTVWGVVGDALNPVTDAIRREERMEWIGVRHEEAGAFAAGAQAQLTGRIGVCAGTVGPGSVHLLNGLYDAKKSHSPVLAICGQVPRAEMGTDYFQEVDNDQLFSDVAVFNQTVTDPAQLPHLLELAVNTAYARRGVAVLTLPGDIGGEDVPDGDASDLRFVEQHPPGTPAQHLLHGAAERLNGRKVTILAGIGARGARDELLAAAEELGAPMVLSLKAKEGLEQDNPYQVGQSGLIGNPAAQYALEHCDTLLMVGTDFPYPEWLPSGKTVIQIDADGAHIGRRTHVDLALVGDSASTLAALRPLLAGSVDRAHLESSRERYESWWRRQEPLTDPEHDHRALGRIRRMFDNPEHAIRPEQLADALDRLAADDAVFTTDTGMPTVWLSRFVTFTGTRQLLGSYNLGSMANALPQALGASAVDRSRQVVACAGDGGLTMLLGELITAVSHRLPVTVVVFDNSRLGMVKLEQEQGALPEHGTELANPDLSAVARACGLHAVRVEKAGDVDAAVGEALAHDGPSLVDVVVNPDEISLPPRTTVSQAWGFAVAKMEENLVSRGGRA
jgi:pyruvate dehydrogenase (quinone)